MSIRTIANIAEALANIEAEADAATRRILARRKLSAYAPNLLHALSELVAATKSGNEIALSERSLPTEHLHG